MRVDVENWSKELGFVCRRGQVRNTAKDSNNSFLVFSAPNPEDQELANIFIFFHGTGNDAWFPQACLIENILKSGTTVAVVNLPGHGQHDNSHLDCDLLGEFVSLVVIHFSSEFVHHKLILAGQSLGAAAIVEYFANKPSSTMIDRVVLITLPLRPKVNFENLFFESTLALYSGFWHLVRIYGILGSIPAIGPFRRKRFPIRLATKYNGASYIKVIGTWFENNNWTAKLSSLKLPTLVISARQDRVATAEDAKTIASSTKFSKLVMIERQSHFSIMGSRLMADAICRWLRSGQKT